MKRVALLLLLAACKTTSSAESHASVDAKTDTDTATAKTVTSRVETGPETITTTTEEFAGDDETAIAPDTDGGIVQQSPDTKSTVVQRPRRVLVKRTVIVDTKAPVVADTRTEAARTTEQHSEVKGETQAKSEHTMAPVGIFAVLAGLWPWLLVAAFVVAGVVAWRVFRSRVP